MLKTTERNFYFIQLYSKIYYSYYTLLACLRNLHSSNQHSSFRHGFGTTLAIIPCHTIDSKTNRSV